MISLITKLKAFIKSTTSSATLENKSPEYSHHTPEGSFRAMAFSFQLLSIFCFFTLLAITAYIVIMSVYHIFLLASAHVFQLFLFPYIALQMFVTAAGTTQFLHPVYNLLSLMATAFFASTLFLAGGQEFLAFTFLIVYIGGVAILFLFVLILLDIKKLTRPSADQFLQGVAALFFIILFFTVQKQFDTITSSALESNFVQLLEQYIEFQHRDLYQIGLRLYTEQVALFAVITIALLAAMIAAIALTMPTMVLGSEKRVFSWARTI